MHLPLPGGCYPVRFDRYNPYFTKSDEYGLDLLPYEFYRYVYPFSQESLRNIAYYFQDHNYAADYTAAMIEWIGKLKQQVAEWNARWQGADGVCHPDLYFAQPALVFDSRSGTAVEHCITDLSRQVLDVLIEPKTLVALAKAFADVPGFDADREIAILRDKALVFQEEDRFLIWFLRARDPDSRSMCLEYARTPWHYRSPVLH